MYKLSVLAFVRRGLWDRTLRVDMHRAVKMLSRKVEFISVGVTHPFCEAGHQVCLQLFTLVMLSLHSYICICETTSSISVADLMIDLLYSRGPAFLVYFLIILKIPLQGHPYSCFVDAAPISEIMKYSKSFSNCSFNFGFEVFLVVFVVSFHGSGFSCMDGWLFLLPGYLLWQIFSRFLTCGFCARLLKLSVVS